MCSGESQVLLQRKGKAAAGGEEGGEERFREEAEDTGILLLVLEGKVGRMGVEASRRCHENSRRGQP